MVCGHWLGWFSCQPQFIGHSFTVQRFISCSLVSSCMLSFRCMIRYLKKGEFIVFRKMIRNQYYNSHNNSMLPTQFLANLLFEFFFRFLTFPSFLIDMDSHNKLWVHSPREGSERITQLGL